MKSEPTKLELSKETLRRLTTPTGEGAPKYPTTTVLTRFNSCTCS